MNFFGFTLDVPYEKFAPIIKTEYMPWANQNIDFVQVLDWWCVLNQKNVK